MESRFWNDYEPFSGLVNGIFKDASACNMRLCMRHEGLAMDQVLNGYGSGCGTAATHNDLSCARLFGDTPATFNQLRR